MSDHAPSASPRRWRWQRFGGKFLVVSILAHVLFAVVAGRLIFQTIQRQRRHQFAAPAFAAKAQSRAVQDTAQGALNLSSA